MPHKKRVSRFDPRKANPAGRKEPIGLYGRSVLGEHFEKEGMNSEYWLGGPTLGFPLQRAVRSGETTLKIIRELYTRIRRGDKLALKELREYYGKKTRSAREAIKTLFRQKDAEIIFATNATDATAIIRNMVDVRENERVVITTETGGAIEHAVKGLNPWDSKYMFRSSVNLFGHSMEEISNAGFPKSGTNVHVIDLRERRLSETEVETERRDTRHWLEEKKQEETIEGQRTPYKTNESLEREIDSLILREDTRLLIIPQNSRMGRKINVKKIGKFVAAENIKRRQAGKREILFAVDGAQTVGRVSPNEIKTPLEYCHFYFFTGAKSLGAPLGSGAVIARPGTVRNFAENLANSPYGNLLKFYQFEGHYPEIEDKLSRKKRHAPVSLPEISGMDTAMRRHWWGIHPIAYKPVRWLTKKIIQRNRNRMVEELNRAPGVIMETISKNAPTDNSIISFYIDREKYPRADPARVRDILGSGELGEITTLGVIVYLPKKIGGKTTTTGMLRMSIPQNRKMAPVKKITRLLFRAIELANSEPAKKG